MEQLVQVLMLVAMLFLSGSQQLATKPVNGGRASVNPSNRHGGNPYNSGMGPYDIDVQIIRICDDPGTHSGNYKLEAYNTKTNGVSKIMYRGNFTIPFTNEEMDTLNLKVTAYRTKDKKEFMMLNHTENLCKATRGSIKDMNELIRKKLGLEGVECYIPKGFYTFTAWEVDVKLPPPVLEYGNYRAIVEILADNKRFACVAASGVVKQKG